MAKGEIGIRMFLTVIFKYAYMSSTCKKPYEKYKNRKPVLLFY